MLGYVCSHSPMSMHAHEHTHILTHIFWMNFGHLTFLRPELTKVYINIYVWRKMLFHLAKPIAIEVRTVNIYIDSARQLWWWELINKRQSLKPHEIVHYMNINIMECYEYSILRGEKGEIKHEKRLWCVYCSPSCVPRQLNSTFHLINFDSICPHDTDTKW